MCGICGIFNVHRGSSVILPETVVRMRDELAHRGPDSAGLYINDDQQVGLGFRRLAIIDLSPNGHQPMANEDDSIWIVFNGEIYNHAAYRSGLEQRGHRYRGRSDTETILHLYEEHGLEVVEHLHGMFAFALWDERRRRLLLARDRLGVKPLYYTFVGGTLLFASEIKALLRHPLVRPEVNLQALYHYLTFVTTPAPDTLFKNIYKLPPGYILTVSEGGHLHEEQYWDAIIPDAPEYSEEEYIERVRELLRDSVKQRMMSDVPFGVLLSGGVDSSTNVALMAELTEQPVETFTVGFQGHERYNELQYARQIAQQFGTNHHEVMINHQDAIDYLPKLIYSQDEPIADPVCVPLYFVSRLVRESGVIVAQVGEGSDELFCGYDVYMRALRNHAEGWRRLQQLPYSARRLLHWAARPIAEMRGEYSRLDGLRKAATGQELFWGGAIAFTESQKQSLLQPDYRASYGARCSWSAIEPYYARIKRIKPDADYLEQMTYLELKLRLPELLLMRVDKITMSNSIEAREPFLDHRLVELAMSIPQHIKVNREAKSLLKRAVQGIIPDNIIHRPKQGFSAPIGEWFRNELSTQVREVLLEGQLRHAHLFDYTYIETMLDQHQQHHHDHSFTLWNLFNLTLWYEHWVSRA